MSEKCLDLKIELLAVATQMAMEKSQVVGKKHDYYITLAQLELLLRGVTAES